jgi:hypothetical protein
MKRRIYSIVIALVLLFTTTLSTYACDEDQSDTYVSQIIFGDNASKYQSDESFKMILDALYLCSEQSDNTGTSELATLKKLKVRGLPSIATINVKSDYLYDCSHTSWTEEYSADPSAKKGRRKILRGTVNKIFDFGFINKLFNSDDGQCDSFSALLYYSHILADYLADDPDESEATAGNTHISAYSGTAAVVVDGNKPTFSAVQKKSTESFAIFSALDSQGRAGVAFANIGPNDMPPAGSRQNIGFIKPSGWNQKKYDGIVNSNPPYLYNRCHLIAHQLSGNDSKLNLITGTRYLNETGMKPYEQEVVKYIIETGNHVLYRATPVYKGSNQVASGVQLEAYSIEDKGAGICFNVYCYNVQPGIDIDYSDGSNNIADKTVGSEDMIPFVVYNPSETNPDLMYEMSKYFEELFSNQKNTGTYVSLMNGINSIASDARSLNADDGNRGRYYMNLKNCEYEYFKQLKLYVPIMLEKEDFFNSVYK